MTDLLLLLVLVSRTLSSPETCLAERYVLAGTKTGYSVVQNTKDSPVTQHYLHHPGCGEYEFMWLLARHGTRNPSALTIRQIKRQLPKIRDQILANHREGRGELCPGDVERLEGWEVDLDQEDDSLLTESGREEMVGLGSRWRRRVPGVVMVPEEIGYTDTQRTRESGREFARGFLNRTQVRLPPPVDNQQLLNFWVVCDRFKKNIQQKINTPLSPERKFIKLHTLPAVRDMVNKINLKLGYRNLTLTFKAVELMWNMCRFELSFFLTKENSSSVDWPWCAVFSTEEMKILEKNEDLHYFYQDGYQYNITREMTAVLLNDLLDSLKSFQSGGPAGNINRFYFAHSETFLPFLARLGLARDDPPLSLENIPEDRQWRTSFIGSEAANLVVLGSRCEGQKVGLKLYLNERLVDHVILPGFVPECQEQKYCELEKFVAHFQDMASTDISEVCRV